MKNRLKYLFITALLLGSSRSLAQIPSVKPVKKEFFLQDTLSFVFDGIIRNDGHDRWKPQWGMLRRSTNGWDTLINVKHLKMMAATFPFSTFQNYKRDFIVIGPPILWKGEQLYPKESLFNHDGQYILTVLSGDGKEIIYSEPFSISTKTIRNSQLAEELRLSPDTVTIENNQLFLGKFFVWRDMMPIITAQSSGLIAKGKLITNKKEMLNGITLKKQYVVKEDQIWMSNYDENEIFKPMHKNYIEATVRSGPLWETNRFVDVIWEFEFRGETYRVIAKSVSIAGIN